jgi:serine/threonine protein kinase
MPVAFEQLGPYKLGKKLGQGGMGAVFEGIDTETGQSVAVKVLAPAMAAEEGFRARFEAEIESLKKLKHPNIVRLFGYGEERGTMFYAMERVDGTSLEELRKSRLKCAGRSNWPMIMASFTAISSRRTS